MTKKHDENPENFDEGDTITLSEMEKDETCEKCGHKANSHQHSAPNKDKKLYYYYCQIKGCSCKKFKGKNPDTKELDLSEKMFWIDVFEEDTNKVLDKQVVGTIDVREFIKRLKDELYKTDNNTDRWIKLCKEIDKLAGKNLSGDL